jgi:hypothetical protein
MDHHEMVSLNQSVYPLLENCIGYSIREAIQGRCSIRLASDERWDAVFEAIIDSLTGGVQRVEWKIIESNLDEDAKESIKHEVDASVIWSIHFRDML